MISPILLGSPSKAVLYHKDGLVDADVAEISTQQPGIWIGRGAEMLGLSGPVKKEEFSNALNGLHPETGEKLTARIKKNRRSGMDYTMAPPKSVSVACLVMGDDRIYEAIKKAEMAAVEVLESQAASRLREGGVSRGERKTGNLIIAKFDHLTARPVKEGGVPDPLLHCHIVIPNLSFDKEAGKDGGWRALETHQMLQVRALADAVYCHELAKELRKLGYELRKKGKQFEIAGISDTTCDKFSKRHADIVERTEKALAAGKGKNEKAVAAVAAHAGRANKDTTSDLPTLQKAWLGQLTDNERTGLMELRENVLYRGAKQQGSPTLMSPQQYQDEFIRLKAITMAAEKTPNRQMSPEEVALWERDWLEFSRSRGYSEKEIEDFQRWLDLHAGLTEKDFANLDPAEMHKQIVVGAIKNSKPVSASAVEAYGLMLPVGYVQDGKNFVREISEKEALDWAVAHCFERASVVKPGMLTEQALRYAAGSNRVSQEGIELLMEQDERFLWSKTRDRLTTQDVARTERVIINMVEQGINKYENLAKEIPAPLLTPVTPEETRRREEENMAAALKREAALKVEIRALAKKNGVKIPAVPKSGKDMDLTRLLSHFSDHQREAVLKAVEKKLPVPRDCDLSIHELCSKFGEAQRAAALATVESKDFLTIFRGGAGRGKSYALIFVEKLLESEGMKVIVAAPQTGQCVSLTQDRGRPAITVASLLATKQPLEKNTVLLVDEAGQIGSQTMQSLLMYAKQYDARIILSGDTKQHASVESGDAMRAIEKFTNAAYANLGTEVEAIKRQKMAWYRKMVALAEEGKAGESFQYFEKLDAAGRDWHKKNPDAVKPPDKARIIEFESDEERRRAVAQKAVELFIEREKISDSREKQKHSTLVISQTRKEVKILNEYIREGLVEKGVLGKEERVIQTLDPTNFTTAEKVMPDSYTAEGDEKVVLIAGAQIIPDKSKALIIAKGAILEFAGMEKGKPVVKTKDGVRCVLSKRDMKMLSVGKLTDTPVREGDLLRLRETLHIGVDVPGKTMVMPDGTERKFMHKQRIPNGSIVRVAGWNDKGQMIVEAKTDKGTTRATVTRPILANRGYSITSYGAQGQTVQSVLYSDSGSKGATSSRQWYVDISRAKERIWLYTNDREDLRERIQRTGERELASEMLEAANKPNVPSKRNTDTPEPTTPSPETADIPEPTNPTVANPTPSGEQPTEADLFMSEDEKEVPAEPDNLPVIEGIVSSETEPEWDDVHAAFRPESDSDDYVPNYDDAHVPPQREPDYYSGNDIGI